MNIELSKILGSCSLGLPTKSKLRTFITRLTYPQWLPQIYNMCDVYNGLISKHTVYILFK